MEDSILDSIKKMLGVSPEDTAFDTDIVIHINSVFSILHQLGGAPPEGFMIDGKDEKWSEFYGERRQISMIKTYLYLKVKMLFDPPPTSFAITANEKLIAELESRITYEEFVFFPPVSEIVLTVPEPTFPMFFTKE